MTTATVLDHTGTTAVLTPLGWGAVQVHTTTGEALGVVEVAAGGRRARPACGCAPLLTATTADAARWLVQHHQQHHEREDSAMSETTPAAPAEEPAPTDTTTRRALTHRWWVGFWAVAAAASLTLGAGSIVHEVSVHNATVRSSCLAMIADATPQDRTVGPWVEVTSPLPQNCARFVGQK